MSNTARKIRPFVRACAAPPLAQGSLVVAAARRVRVTEPPLSPAGAQPIVAPDGLCQLVVSEAKDLPVVLAAGHALLDAVARHARTHTILIVAETAETRDEILRALSDRLSAFEAATPPGPSAVLEIAELRIDEKTHRVTVAGREVRLTRLEYRLLVILAGGTERVHTREELLREVCGLKGTTMTRTIDVHVTRLRAKCGVAGRLIQSVRGVGYRFGERTTAVARSPRGRPR